MGTANMTPLSMPSRHCSSGGPSANVRHWQERGSALTENFSCNLGVFSIPRNLQRDIESTYAKMSSANDTGPYDRFLVRKRPGSRLFHCKLLRAPREFPENVSFQVTSKVPILIHHILKRPDNSISLRFELLIDQCITV